MIRVTNFRANGEKIENWNTVTVDIAQFPLIKQEIKKLNKRKAST